MPAPAQICLDLDQAQVLDAAVRERDELKLKERSYLRELYATRRQVRLERAANQKTDAIDELRELQLKAKDDELTATINQLSRKKRQLVRARVGQVVEGCIILVLTYLVVLK